MKVLTPRPLELTSKEHGTFVALAVIGALVAAVGMLVTPDRLWANWLLVSYYALEIGLAGLCFVAIHYTTGASWSVAIRRVPEAMAGTLPFAVALLAIVLIARPELYAWTGGTIGSSTDAALAFKRAWLTRPFFMTRALVYCAVWTWFSIAIRRRSLHQDSDRDPRWTRGNLRLSAAFLVVFGVTFSLASFDWVMSLEPTWYSTIFGVYNFAGLFQSGLAAVIVVALWLERRGPLQGILNDEHLHDLGKLLFAFSVFWMYIWFSQYLLIWYTDMPAETSHFVRRTGGAWFAVFVANVLLNWVVPFGLLLGRDAKRSRRILGRVAIVVLLGHWVDLYLMILPAVVGGSPPAGLWELGLTAGGFGGFGLVLAWILRGASPVPVGDPQLIESLQYEH